MDLHVTLPHAPQSAARATLADRQNAYATENCRSFLPAEGIGLPFEPNENFGTFSTGQLPIGNLAYPYRIILQFNKNYKGMRHFATVRSGVSDPKKGFQFNGLLHLRRPS
jgi:hypothetical protein